MTRIHGILRDWFGESHAGHITKELLLEGIRYSDRRLLPDMAPKWDLIPWPGLLHCCAPTRSKQNIQRLYLDPTDTCESWLWHMLPRSQWFNVHHCIPFKTRFVGFSTFSHRTTLLYGSLTFPGRTCHKRVFDFARKWCSCLARFRSGLLLIGILFSCWLRWPGSSWTSGWASGCYPAISWWRCRYGGSITGTWGFGDKVCYFALCFSTLTNWCRGWAMLAWTGRILFLIGAFVTSWTLSMTNNKNTINNKRTKNIHRLLQDDVLE